MTKSVVAFLLMPAPLLIWTALLAAQLSATFDVRVGSSDYCGPNATGTAESDYCFGDPRPETRNDLWQVNIDCSVPDTLKLEIKDLPSEERSSFVYGPDPEMISVSEVRIQCTDGIAQAEVSVNCSIGSGAASRSHTISNLSAAGIQPGWTCSFKGCFANIETYNGVFSAYTPTASCILPKVEANTISPSTTATSTEVGVPMTTRVGDSTTSVPGTADTVEANTISPSTTTKVGVSMTTGVGDSTTSVPGTADTELPVLSTESILIPIIVLLLLISVALLMIGVISVLTKQQKRRKTAHALLVLDRRNMVFDPEYIPSICIDKQSYSTHRSSMISLDYLQFLTVMEKPCQFPADVTFDENDYTTDSTFSHNLSMSNSKQQNSVVGTTKDMVICPEEFPGSNTSGYVVSGHSNGFTSPQQMDSTEREFQSPSDCGSELTLSYGGCQSSGYIGNAQLGNSSLVVRDEDASVTNLETLSGDSSSLLIQEDDPVMKEASARTGAVGLDRCSHPSSSSTGYVEQLNTSDQPLQTRYDDNVFQFDVELTQEQCDGYVQSQHPIAVGSTTEFNNSHQTAGYIVEPQNAHLLHPNLHDAEVAHLDDMDYPMNNSTTSNTTQSTHMALESCEHDQSFPLDMPHLTNTDGYVLNDHLNAAAAATVMLDGESQDLSITLDCESTSDEEEEKETSPNHHSSSSEDGVLNRHKLDLPCSPENRSRRGYITTEDIDMTKYTSREIVVPSNQVSPTQIEPSFTVHLDFDSGIDSCRDQLGKDEAGYVCNSGHSGVETDHSSDMKHCHSLASSNQTIEGNGYVSNHFSEQSTCAAIPAGTDQRGQYVSYDFRSMASELRDSYSTSITPEPVDNNNNNPDQGMDPMHIHYQAKSNYYPASDLSSGYLSGSSVSGDTSAYIGMDKFEQVDLYSYR